MATTRELINNSPASIQNDSAQEGYANTNYKYSPLRPKESTETVKSEDKNQSGVTAKPKPMEVKVQGLNFGGQDKGLVPGQLSNEEIYKRNNSYTPPSAEELGKERKKQKREEIYAAVSDGISSIANLYFTTQGAPSMYNGKNNMSKATQARWDKLKKNREENASAYNNGLLKMRQQDEENRRYAEAKEDKDREWRRTLGLDADKRKKDKQEQKDKEDAVAYKKEQDAISNKFKEADRDLKEKKQASDEKFRAGDGARENRELALKEQAANKGKDSDTIVIADNDGNEFEIPKQKWTNSWQQAYKILLEEEFPESERELVWVDNNQTSAEKKDYVLQHWNNSDKVKEFLGRLSGKSSDTTRKASEKDEDIIDYVPSTTNHPPYR